MPLLGIGDCPGRLLAMAVVTILAVSGTVSIAAASTTRGDRPIEIVFAGADRDIAMVREIVLELLQRDGVVVSWTQSANIEPQSLPARGGGSGAARIGIDLTRPNDVRLFLARSDEKGGGEADGDREWVVARRVPLSQGLDEVGRELIGQIVESAALVLAKGREDQPLPGDPTAVPSAARSDDVPVGRASPEAATVHAEAHPNDENAVVSPLGGSLPSDASGLSNRLNPSSASGVSSGRSAGISVSPGVPVGLRSEAFLHYRIGLGYGADVFLPGAVVEHGPLIASTLMLGRTGRRMVLGFSARYDMPVSANTDKVALRFDGAIITIEAGAEFRMGSRSWVSVLAGGGLDITHIAPERVMDSTLTLAPPVVVVSAAARASVGAGTRILPSVDLGFFLYADFSLIRPHYDVYQDGRSSPTLTPRPIRPGASLIFCFAR